MTMSKKVLFRIPETFKLMYRSHGAGDRVRVWQSTWGFDQFEVFSATDFAALTRFCQRLSIPLIAADDED